VNLDCIYEPLDYQKAAGAKRNPDKCAYQVYWRDGVYPHQCSRNPKHTIEGYGFCTQHTNMIRKRQREVRK
jgi:hypothetical protein